MQLSDSEKAELAEVYENAAEYLEEYGWDKTLGLHGGPRCFMGAIHSVLGDYQPLYFTAASFACDVLELKPFSLTYVGSTVGNWNDEQEEASPVINTLHALANKLR